MTTPKKDPSSKVLEMVKNHDYKQLGKHKTANFNVVNEKGETPFMIAVENLDTQMIRLLLYYVNLLVRKNDGTNPSEKIV